MNTMIPTEKTRPVFLIREYKVTDHKGKPKTFHTYQEQPDVSVIDATEGIFRVEGDRVYNRYLRYYKYTTDLKKYDRATVQLNLDKNAQVIIFLIQPVMTF